MDYLPGFHGSFKLGPGCSHYREMTGVSGFFRKYCESTIAKLQPAELRRFFNCKDNESRIRFLYPYTIDVPAESDGLGKDYQRAEQDKLIGNKYFYNNEFKQAIFAYSNGLIYCPQTCEKSRTLAAILAANRSAAFFSQRQYEKCINDVEYVLSLEAYPKHLLYKLWSRKAKCHKSSPNQADEKAKEAYKAAITSLQFSNLAPAAMDLKLQEFKMACGMIVDRTTVQQGDSYVRWVRELYHTNRTFPAVHRLVSFEHNETQGRYAVAMETFQPGSILAEELAHSSVLAADNILLNCQNCLVATSQPYPCPNCAYVVYCSLDCMAVANEAYHKYECGIHPTLLDSGASINCCMALRIITQSCLGMFKSRKEKGDLDTDEPFYLDCTGTYFSSDYATVYNLCSHNDRRAKTEFVHFTVMAIYLLRLLKTTNYFNTHSNDTILTNDEALIGGLILHHLQVLQFNAHEISELREASPGPLDAQNEPNFKALYIGGGVFPTVALFNHSCDPSIVRYNRGNKVIVQSIKLINKGDIIYENYGPIYTNMEKNERQSVLRDRYWFDCRCMACEEDWPQFHYMQKERTIQCPCATVNCHGALCLHENLLKPFLFCTQCGLPTNILPILSSLMELEGTLAKAESYYKNHNFPKALGMYLEALTVYYRHIQPPFLDLVKVQQRARTCMVHKGNKSVKYYDY